MTRQWMIYLLGALVLVLAGCGDDPKTASKSLFAHLIETEYLDGICPSVDDYALNPARKIPMFQRGSRLDFPVTLRYLENSKVRFSDPEEERRPYEALVQAGLAKLSLTKGKDGAGRPETVYRYDLTSEGKARRISTSSLYGTLYGFCVGKYKLVGVSRFSPPNKLFGYTVSRVWFDVEVADVPAWAHSAAFKTAFPGLGPELKSPQEMKTIMVLLDDGWHHESATNKK